MKRSEIDWTSVSNTKGAMTFTEATKVKGALDAGRSKGQRFSPIIGEIIMFPTKEQATFTVDVFKGTPVIKIWVFTDKRGKQLLPLATLRKTPDIPEECTELFRDPENKLGDQLSLVGVSDLEMLEDLYGKDIEAFKEYKGHLYSWVQDSNKEWHHEKDKDGNQVYVDASFWKFKFVEE